MSRRKTLPDTVVEDDVVAVPETTEPSSTDWSEKIFPLLERKLAEAEAESAMAREQLEMAELQVVLGKPRAEELVVEFREAVRVGEMTAASLRGAMQRANRERAKATRREDEEAKQRRIGNAKQLVSRRVMLADDLDKALKQAGAIAADLEANARNLSGYSDVTRIGLHRMQLSGNFSAAIFASAPALARALDLTRLKPLGQMEPLAVIEARQWSLFCPIETPPHRDSESVAVEIAASDTDASLGEYGARALDVVTAGSHTYDMDELIPPEVCLSWPIKNRVALRSIGKVEFFGEPQDDDQKR